jgi:hypothetical protein
MHEIHRPHLNDRVRNGQWLWRFTLQPPSRLDPQVEFQFTINPINPLRVKRQTLDIPSIQEAQPKAPVAVVVRQPHQPIPHVDIVVIPLRQVSIAVLTDIENPAGHSD